MYVTQDNNFCRVFELPLTFPESFCFGGGFPVSFQLIDWFNPIPLGDMIFGTTKPWEEYVPLLTDFLLKKDYVIPGRQYLLITDFGKALVVQK